MAARARTKLDETDREFLEAARVGRLATATTEGRPHVIPLCYAVLDEGTLAFAVDDKVKTPGKRLRRLRNLDQNDRFALVIDHWDEDWQRLAWVLVEGRACCVQDPARCRRAIAALRERYPPYVDMDLRADVHVVFELRIDRVRRWHALDGSV